VVPVASHSFPRLSSRLRCEERYIVAAVASRSLFGSLGR
jgi:hypothetical protein